MEQLFVSAGQGLSFNTFGILLALVGLETVLSGDNAVALAAMVQDMKDPEEQRQALNWGLLVALILRLTLLLTATWVIQFWQFEFAGAIYLLWLSGKHLWERFFASKDNAEGSVSGEKSYSSIWQIIPLIALTDLAFSIDSVTAAVALSDRAWLVLTGCLIGVVTLRFMAGLFVQLLTKFIYLQDAAYLTVMGVGTRLLFKALLPDYVPPEWMLLMLMAVLFAWGFSKRVEPEVQG